MHPVKDTNPRVKDMEAGRANWSKIGAMTCFILTAILLLFTLLSTPKSNANVLPGDDARPARHALPNR